MKTYNKKIALLVIFSVTLICISIYFLIAATNKNHKKLTKLELIEQVDSSFNDSHLAGSLAIVKEGTIVYSSSYGYADMKKKQLNTTNTLYPIASLQKTMTAVIIGQLIRENKLSYNTTIETYYPKLENSDTITIRDLLDHTSGYGMPEMPSATLLTTEEEQLDNVLDTLYDTGGNIPYYSNGNYSLLAGIISDIEKKPYKASLKERIFSPLNLEETFLWDELPKERALPKEYHYLDNEDYNTGNRQYSEKLMSTLLGAGNVYSTISDLSRFEMSLDNGKLLNHDDYLELFNFSDNETVMMSGNISTDYSLGGFSSYFYGNVTDQTFIIFLANQSTNDYPYELLTNIYQQLLLF